MGARAVAPNGDRLQESARDGQFARAQMVVDFAANHGMRNPDPSDASIADADASLMEMDGLGDGAEPDSSTSGPREVTATADQFRGMMSASPARYVQYKCCDSTGSTCSIWIQGNDVTCRDTATWTMDAAADCESRGLTAMGIGLYVGC